MPVDISSRRTVTPRARDSGLAAAQLPFIRNATPSVVRQVATANGFQHVGNDEYRAGDGSWVALSVNGTVERGVGGNVFSAVPPPPSRAAPTRTASATASGTAPARQSGSGRQPTPGTAAGRSPPAAQSTPATSTPRGAPPVGGQTGSPSILPLNASTRSALQQLGLGTTPATAAAPQTSGATRARRNSTSSATTSAAPTRSPAGGQRRAARTQSFNVANMQRVRASAQHSNLAVASLPWMTADSASLTSAARAAGFSRAGTDQWTHADGSWVALINGRIERGVGNTVLNGVPPAPPPPPAAPSQGHRRYTQLPSSTWPWYQQNTALGKLPIMADAATARTELSARGFTSRTYGATERWAHPDGSYVDITGGRLALGWQQWTLGQLPYNNRTSP